MCNDLIDCISSFCGIPSYVLILTIIIFVVFLFAGFQFIKGKNRLFFLASLSLFLYIALVFFSAVLFRPKMNDHQYHFELFWSYSKILEGEKYLLRDDVQNIILFVPIGFLLRVVMQSNNILVVFLFACLFSSCIELFQYYGWKGVAETDDILHNSIGCLLGYYLCLMCIYIWSYFLKYFRNQYIKDIS